MPRVRVYLLTYRRNHLLPRALASLRAQTFTDWVCELHNDDPADPFPAKLVAETADPRITLKQHETNLGATRTFNLVFAPVAEPYVCLLEDDNWWEPGFLATLVAAADAHPEAGFVWCDQRIWQETPDGEWRDTGQRTMTLLHPQAPPVTVPTLCDWPQPRQRFDTFHYNGSTLFRASACARLQIPPTVPQICMETFRDRALRWPGLFLPEPLVNFSWTLASTRESQTELWLAYRALLDGSFLHCCPPHTISAAEFWRAAVEARPTQTGSTLLHAWVAGRFAEFAALARPRDWLRVAVHALRRPLAFWRTLRARSRHPGHWDFLVTETRRRFSESAAGGVTGWGRIRPAREP
ncbi:MAG: glycosyltransferase [Opitutae bacterium]|nr:glycosyltransferase [Opitutae bacterium]